MKSIEQFVRDGIDDIEDLRAALQTAIRLEFSTIPPYLCAEWSIITDPDPRHGAGRMIKEIAEEEMYHFAIAADMLSSIGGKPSIAYPGFVPLYPSNELPGGIPQKLAVDLRKLSVDQLQVFMQIEYPEFPPVAIQKMAGPATIGEFYSTISDAFISLNPPIVLDAPFVEVQIKSVADAQRAIARIQGEGEGTPGNPEQPPEDADKLAHYYVFKQILVGKRLVKDAAGLWSFSGSDIEFPTTYDFGPSPSDSADFNLALSQLLIGLETCWTEGAEPDTDAMRNLRTLGKGLIEKGVRPDFLWDPTQPT